MALTTFVVYVGFALFFDLVGVDSGYGANLSVSIAAAVAYFVSTPVLVLKLTKPFVDPLAPVYYPILLSWPISLGSYVRERLIGVIARYMLFSVPMVSIASALLYSARDPNMVQALIGCGFGLLTCVMIASSTLIAICSGARFSSPAVSMLVAFAVPLILANSFANTLRGYAILSFLGAAVVVTGSAAVILWSTVSYFNTLDRRHFSRSDHE
ncbi:hypothetical protein [Actinomyces qiguomingii]|uniref:hypothetical protein n=1 Tax=Actinomyces qiguomingii TaxID=2057800 RepID=UPI000FFE55DA|nr:hypothetical protein [Actinomyces qiguomingii]